MKRLTLRSSVSVGFFILDLCALLLAFQCAFYTRFYSDAFLQFFPVTKGIPNIAIYHQALCALLPACMAVMVYTGTYKDLFPSGYDEFIRVLKSAVLCALLAATMSFGYRAAEYSRLLIALWGIYVLIFMYLGREFAKAFLRKLQNQLVGPHRVLIIGKGRVTEAIQKMIERQPFVKAYFHPTLPETVVLEAEIRKQRISEVLLALGDLPQEDVLETASACEHLNIPCKIVPNILELRRGEIVMDAFLGLPTFRIKPLSLHGTDYFLKRAFDISLSLILLAILAVPFLIIAILICIDTEGPILHKQERMGFRFQTFMFYKFRTMVVNANAMIEQIKHLNDRKGPVFKMKNDPRITRVGKWLRRYSLDELPQIFNVLRGDMSFVGPRPQVLWEAAHYDEVAKKRLRVKPGITGLWQVSGRASLSYEDMINLDIYYLENWSLGLDLKILLRTIPAVVAGEGAY